MSFSNTPYSIYVNWSMDNGTNTDYQDSLVGTSLEQVISVPVRARWVSINVVPSIPPQVFRMNVSLNSNSLGLVNLSNAGTGAKLYKSSVSKVRSIISSDSSILVQELADTIDLTSTGLAIDSRDYTFSSGSDVTFPSPAPADPNRAFWSRNSNIIYPQWLTPENVGVLRSISIMPFANLVTSSTGFCDTPTNITGGSVDIRLIEITSSNYDLATATYNTLWLWSLPYTEFNTADKNYECKSTYGNLTTPIIGGKKLSMLITNNLTTSGSAGFRSFISTFSFSKLQATTPLTDLGQVSTTSARVYPRTSVLNKIQLDVYNPQHPNINVDLINDDLIFTASGTYDFNFTTSCTSNATYRLYVNGIMTNSVSLSSGVQSSSFLNVAINGGDLIQIYFIDGGAGTMSLNSYVCTITS